MKLGPVTKPDKGNTSTSKIFDDDVMSEIVTSLSFSDLWPICSHLVAGFL